MKSFLISVCFLVLFIFTTAVNCFFVTDILQSITDTLQDMTEISEAEHSEEFSKVSDSVLEFWNSRRLFLSLSIDDGDLRDCTTALENLRELSLSRDFAVRNAALKEALTQIRSLYFRERFSFINIF